MTQKKLSGILLLITMIALLASCSKRVEPIIEPQPVPIPGKLAKLSFKDGAYDSLFYNADGKISKIKNYYAMPGPYTEIFTFEYNAAKQLSRITDSNGELYEYTYTNGELTAVKHYINGVKHDYRLFDYQDGKLSAVEEYYQPAPGVPGHEFTAQRNFYYYPDGNLKQEVSYSFAPQTRVPVKDFTIEHSDYDSKLNPTDLLGRFLYMPFIQLSKNNPGKMTAKSEANGASTEFVYEYTYDAASNPLTRKMSYTSGGQLITETVLYHYYP